MYVFLGSASADHVAAGGEASVISGQYEQQITSWQWDGHPAPPMKQWDPTIQQLVSCPDHTSQKCVWRCLAGSLIFVKNVSANCFSLGISDKPIKLQKG